MTAPPCAYLSVSMMPHLRGHGSYGRRGRRPGRGRGRPDGGRGAMADDKWLTFDCYGTIADWNTGMRAALTQVAGVGASVLLTSYHQAELVLESGPWRAYREVLTEGL